MATTDGDASATVGADAEVPLFSPEQLLWIDKMILNRRTDPPVLVPLSSAATDKGHTDPLTTPASYTGKFFFSLLVQVHCNVRVGWCAQHIRPVNNSRRGWHIPGLHTCGTQCFPKAAMYPLVGSARSQRLI